MVAQTLIGRALTDGLTWERLTQLTEQVGPRLSGSPGAEEAVRWALARFAADGVKAHREPVRVPHWVRGVEAGELLLPSGHAQSLALTALGGSAGTSATGVTGEVLELHSLEALHALGVGAKGKIIFFNHTMAVAADYRKFTALRTLGAEAAAAQGALAMVVRSLSTASLRTPHTGVTIFTRPSDAIPAAALSSEDADALSGALTRGPVRIHLTLGCKTLPDVDSANVVAEIRGSGRPEEVVLLGAHLDSWDLATGAEDDGTGVAMAMEVAHLIAALPRAPRRTVRIVLFMNEENGGAGGKAYAATHAAELSLHVAAMELDSGGGRPVGIALEAGEGSEASVRAWLPPLRALGVTELVLEEAGGSDLVAMASARIPLVGLRQEKSRYFDFHHSAADTLDKIDPSALSESAAVMAWITHAIADSPKPLPRPVSLPAHH